MTVRTTIPPIGNKKKTIFKRLVFNKTRLSFLK